LPLYEYECQKCGARFERIQKFSDPLLRTCEKCGGELERLVSPSALHFKGSGWYITDYARKSSSEPSGKAERGGVGKSAGSSPAKPAAPKKPTEPTSKE